MAEWIKDFDEDYFCSECGHHLEPYELLPYLIQIILVLMKHQSENPYSLPVKKQKKR